VTDGERTGTDASEPLESPLFPFDESEFFRQLVANTSEGLLTIDEESTIVFANPQSRTSSATVQKISSVPRR